MANSLHFYPERKGTACIGKIKLLLSLGITHKLSIKPGGGDYYYILLLYLNLCIFFFEETLSEDLKIIIKINDRSKAEFIDKVYLGAVTFLKNTNDELTLEGRFNIVIKNIANDLRIKLHTKKPEEILFTFILNDNLNHE